MPASRPSESLSPVLPEAVWKRRFRQRVSRWFAAHARDLPWRRTRDPYAIWVSEIMLQQTQVATVQDYYSKFLAEFPTVTVLAAADEAAVLRQWEGLGYYRRARQMHQAARLIVTQHRGQFPREGESIRALPGVGRYTAGAIASIAWDARQPILEANTIRLFARLLAYREDPRRAAAQRLFWEFAELLLPAKQVGSFNQALMELGSTICTPRAPNCAQCPVQQLCPTRRAGLQEVIPAESRKLAYQQVREAAVIVRRNRQVLLRRCGPGERWAGLWDFPRFVVQSRSAADLASEAAEQVAQLTGQQIRLGRHLTSLKHAVTRFRITLSCHEAEWLGGSPTRDLCWLEPHQLEDYPLSVTGRRLSRLVQSEPGTEAGPPTATPAAPGIPNT